MWPDLFGSGWIWNALVAGASLTSFLGLVWLFGDVRRPPEGPDPLQRIWRRYEQGDLTGFEFERLMRAAPENAGAGR